MTKQIRYRTVYVEWREGSDLVTDIGFLHGDHPDCIMLSRRVIKTDHANNLAYGMPSRIDKSKIVKRINFYG